MTVHEHCGRTLEGTTRLKTIHSYMIVPIIMNYLRMKRELIKDFSVKWKRWKAILMSH